MDWHSVALEHAAVRLVASLTLTLCLSGGARAQDPTPPHVRGTDGRSESLIADGVRRSRAVRLLIRRLDRLATLVFVEHGMLPAGLAGQLTLLSSGASWRYVRIVIDCRQPADAQVAALGHELQHAVEVAEAATLDADSLRAFYQRIGFSIDGGRQRFETEAARQAGARVRRELANAASRLAAH